MAKYYKLIDAISTSQAFNLPYDQNGTRVYKYYSLYPGQRYVEHADDPWFIEALKSAKKRLTYSVELENALKACNAKYSVEVCKVCGGRKKFLDVWLVEVVE